MGALKLSYLSAEVFTRRHDYENIDEQSETCFAHMKVVHKSLEQFTVHGNYYTYGATMPGRRYNTTGTEFGFGGKREDIEVYGEGNGYDFGDRMYDPRLGRWLSMDPHQKRYAHLSPYNAFENNPIYFNDPSGQDAEVTIVGNTMTISAKIYITGSGANMMKAYEIQKAIMAKWGGNYTYTDANGKVYNVKFDVGVEEYKPDFPFQAPPPNLIHVEPKPDNFRSFVTTGNSGVWTSRTSKKSPYAHEFAHLLGLDDGYFDVYDGDILTQSDLDDATKVRPEKKENYSENDIVVDPTNGIVTQDDINALGDYVMMQYDNRQVKNSNDWKGKIEVPLMNLGKGTTVNDELKMQGQPQMIGKKYGPSNGGGEKKPSEKKQKSTGEGHQNVRFL